MKILLVEDDLALAAGLAEILRRAGWAVEQAASAEEGLEHLEQVDVLVTDIRLPGMDGLELLKEARKRRPTVEIIVMTGHGSIPNAVETMRRGARTYITKPFEPEQLLLHLREVEEVIRLREVAAGMGRGKLVGASRAMRRVYSEIDTAAASEAAVLLCGETGTGKELAAQAIHAQSARRNGPFVAVNLGALPRDLAESELFGHEKGAFTGSQGRKRGRFQLAHGGTLFLDEINSLPLELQPKLLRALETREVWPLGSEQAVPVDVRIMAATNVDLRRQVETGAFREDLYYRLHVLRVDLPPLRDRPEDIPLLVRELMDRLVAVTPGLRLEISAGALSRLVGRPWPGNVRELSNALERAAARAQAAQPAATNGETNRAARIEEANLDPDPASLNGLTFKQARARVAEEWARGAVRAALTATRGNASEAARQLKMNRTAFLRLVHRYRIERHG